MGDAVRPPYESALALGRWAWENRSLIRGRVTLAGGEAHSLTLREFLDAAYVLLVEEGLRMGVPLEGAIDAVKDWRAGGIRPAGGTAPATQAVPSEAAVVSQNQRALAELSKMMPGLGL